MKLPFSHIINKHKGKTAFVIGHGPSQCKHVDLINRYQNHDHIRLDCNDWYNFCEKEPTYCVIANSVYTIKEKINKMNEYKCMILYSDSVDLTPREWIKKHLKPDYIAYDQRHRNGDACPTKRECCKHAIPGRRTIQEHLMDVSGIKAGFYPANLVTSSSLAFALIMGCNPIYLSGIDMDYKIGYSNPQIGVPHGHIDQAGALEDLRIIKKYADHMGVRVCTMAENICAAYFKVEVPT